MSRLHERRAHAWAEFDSNRVFPLERRARALACAEQGLRLDAVQLFRKHRQPGTLTQLARSELHKLVLIFSTIVQ